MHTATLRRFGYLALAAALATLLVTAMLSLWEWRSYEAVFAKNSETRGILTLNQSLVELLVDAETGQRGFLLTGRDEYLAPYNVANQRIPATLAELSALEMATPGQRQRMKQLRSAIDDKLGELQTTIDLARSSGHAVALGVVKTDRGREAMVRIREVSRQIQDTHDQQWTASWVTLRAATQRIRIAVLLATVLLVFLVGGGGYALRSATRQTERTRDLLRSTLYSIGDGVIATDKAGQVQMMNAVAERLTGYSEAEARGSEIEEIFRIVHESSRETVENPVRQVLRNHVAVSLANHTVLISKTGVAIPIDDCGTPVSAPGGRALGVVLVFRDVSERKKRSIRRGGSHRSLRTPTTRSSAKRWTALSQAGTREQNGCSATRRRK